MMILFPEQRPRAAEKKKKKTVSVFKKKVDTPNKTQKKILKVVGRVGPRFSFPKGRIKTVVFFAILFPRASTGREKS